LEALLINWFGKTDSFLFVDFETRADDQIALLLNKISAIFLSSSFVYFAGRLLPKIKTPSVLRQVGRRNAER
jgi:hypothetical protein